MRKLKDNRGQTLVEWALILPIFLMLVFGIIDFGFAMSKQHSINNLTKELARSASIGTTEADLTTREAELTDTIGDVTVGYDPALSDREKGIIITVNATYSYHPITPVIPGAFSLQSSSQTIIEKPPE